MRIETIGSNLKHVYNMFPFLWRLQEQLENRFSAEIYAASHKFSEELLHLRQKVEELSGGRDGEKLKGLGSLKDLCAIEEELGDVRKQVKEAAYGFKVCGVCVRERVCVCVCMGMFIDRGGVFVLFFCLQFN